MDKVESIDNARMNYIRHLEYNNAAMQSGICCKGSAKQLGVVHPTDLNDDDRHEKRLPRLSPQLCEDV